MDFFSLNMFHAGEALSEESFHGGEDSIQPAPSWNFWMSHFACDCCGTRNVHVDKSDTTTKCVFIRTPRCVRSTQFQNTLYLVQSGVLCNMLITVCIL